MNSKKENSLTQTEELSTGENGRGGDAVMEESDSVIDPSSEESQDEDKLPDNDTIFVPSESLVQTVAADEEKPTSKITTRRAAKLGANRRSSGSIMKDFPNTVKIKPYKRQQSQPPQRRPHRWWLNNVHWKNPREDWKLGDYTTFAKKLPYPRYIEGLKCPFGHLWQQMRTGEEYKCDSCGRKFVLGRVANYSMGLMCDAYECTREGSRAKTKFCRVCISGNKLRKYCKDSIADEYPQRVDGIQQMVREVIDRNTDQEDESVVSDSSSFIKQLGYQSSNNQLNCQPNTRSHRNLTHVELDCTQWPCAIEINQRTCLRSNSVDQVREQSNVDQPLPNDALPTTGVKEECEKEPDIQMIDESAFQETLKDKSRRGEKPTSVLEIDQFQMQDEILQEQMGRQLGLLPPRRNREFEEDASEIGQSHRDTFIPTRLVSNSHDQSNVFNATAFQGGESKGGRKRGTSALKSFDQVRSDQSSKRRRSSAGSQQFNSNGVIDGQINSCVQINNALPQPFPIPMSAPPQLQVIQPYYREISSSQDWYVDGQRKHTVFTKENEDGIGYLTFRGINPTVNYSIGFQEEQNLVIQFMNELSQSGDHSMGNAVTIAKRVLGGPINSNRTTMYRQDPVVIQHFAAFEESNNQVRMKEIRAEQAKYCPQYFLAGGKVLKAGRLCRKMDSIAHQKTHGNKGEALKHKTARVITEVECNDRYRRGTTNYEVLMGFDCCSDMIEKINQLIRDQGLRYDSDGPELRLFVKNCYIHLLQEHSLKSTFKLNVNLMSVFNHLLILKYRADSLDHLGVLPRSLQAAAKLPHLCQQKLIYAAAQMGVNFVAVVEHIVFREDHTQEQRQQEKQMDLRQKIVECARQSGMFIFSTSKTEKGHFKLPKFGNVWDHFYSTGAEDHQFLCVYERESLNGVDAGNVVGFIEFTLETTQVKMTSPKTYVQIHRFCSALLGHRLFHFMLVSLREHISLVEASRVTDINYILIGKHYNLDGFRCSAMNYATYEQEIESRLFTFLVHNNFSLPNEPPFIGMLVDKEVYSMTFDRVHLFNYRFINAYNEINEEARLSGQKVLQQCQNNQGQFQEFYDIRAPNFGSQLTDQQLFEAVGLADSGDMRYQAMQLVNRAMKMGIGQQQNVFNVVNQAIQRGIDQQQNGGSSVEVKADDIVDVKMKEEDVVVDDQPQQDQQPEDLSWLLARCDPADEFLELKKEVAEKDAEEDAEEAAVVDKELAAVVDKGLAESLLAQANSEMADADTTSFYEPVSFCDPGALATQQQQSQTAAQQQPQPGQGILDLDDSKVLAVEDAVTTVNDCDMWMSK